jgi:hypothetical protein
LVDEATVRNERFDCYKQGNITHIVVHARRGKLINRMLDFVEEKTHSECSLSPPLPFTIGQLQVAILLVVQCFRVTCNSVLYNRNKAAEKCLL